MQAIDTIIKRMAAGADAPALFWNDREYSYADFMELVDLWRERLESLHIGKGVVCGFFGEYSPMVCALIFALMQTKAILVPFTAAIGKELPEFMEIAGVEYLFRFDENDDWNLEHFDVRSQNKLIVSFLERDVPGLVVFTSGSTGKPKGILQDCERVMKKFVVRRESWRTLLFLMLDHFGGFNTLLSTFAYGGTAICLPDRNQETVCSVIERSRATLLPTTPTFINLLIASRCYQSYDLSSIRLITYGTEVMPAATLQKLREIFPNARVKQTYGLSELGVLRSKSESDDSVWVKIGGAGFETKVVDDILWIRSEANMVGYLNAPSPFDEDGWMCTGDHVEINGDYMRILGRKSEMINVGGQKVFPAEVETVLLEADNVLDVSVFGAPHPVMGQIVTARVSLHVHEDQRTLVERLRRHCLERMAKYKVPVRFTVVAEDDQRTARFKKSRRNDA